LHGNPKEPEQSTIPAEFRQTGSPSTGLQRHFLLSLDEKEILQKCHDAVKTKPNGVPK